MKIKVPNLNRLDVGGGASFIQNFKKGFQCSENEGEILLIAGATLCDRDTAVEAKSRNIPIVLRVDNILEDSKNRSTGMSRMRDFAELSDIVVYQSEWAKNLLNPYCGDGIVIRNGVDTDIFKEEPIPHDGKRIFYGRFSRGEGKNFNVVQYFWREYCLKEKNDTLVLVGNFSDDIRKINNPFEFHNDENFEFHGVLDSQGLARLMRTCDVALLPYFADACPNMVLEAQACGLPVIYEEYGGTKEVVDFGTKLDWTLTPNEMVEKAIKEKKTFDKERWGIEKMNNEYRKLFTLLQAGTYGVE